MVTREEREARAMTDAQYRLERRLDRIAWEEEVQKPLLAKVRKGEARVNFTSGGLTVRELKAGASAV